MTWHEELALARYVNPRVRNWCAARVDSRRLLAQPGGITEVVRAAYDSLVEFEIRYAYEPYSGDSNEQTIRSPGEILDATKEGTCLDLALLYSGVCMGCRLCVRS